MCLLVTSKVKLSAEPFVTNFTSKFFDSVVMVNMLLKIPTLSESATASFKSAFKGSLTSMNSQVIKEVATLLELLVTAFVIADKQLSLPTCCIVDIPLNSVLVCLRNIFAHSNRIYSRFSFFLEIRIILQNILDFFPNLGLFSKFFTSSIIFQKS